MNIKYPPIAPRVVPGDTRYLGQALAFGSLNDGAYTHELERCMSDYHDAECVCVGSGTTALEMILRYVGWRECTIPFCSHISTAHAAILAGFRKLECSETPFVAADLNGRLAHCGAVADACQSIFTKGLLTNRMAAALSFGALKNITGGTGGAIISKDSKLIAWARRYKSYGRDPGKSDGEAVAVGSNHKMSDINAALAIGQWERRDEIIADRWRLHYEYTKLLGGRIPARHNTEVPWMIDCRVSPEFAASGTFRPTHPQFGHYEHLREYITNWERALAPTTLVYLPSQFGLTQEEIERFAAIILEAHK